MPSGHLEVPIVRWLRSWRDDTIYRAGLFDHGSINPVAERSGVSCRRAALANAPRELVEKRDRWLNPEGASEAELKKRTLTNLYNERPTWLKLAHEKLDRAVLDAYSWPHDLSDDEILARLLALNLERAAGQGNTPAAADDEESGEE